MDVSGSSEALSSTSAGEFIPENLWILTNAPEDSWLELKWLEEYQPSWVVVLVVCAVVVYCAWYYLLVVDKPRLVGGGNKLRKHILNHCPILSHYYYPTFWAPNCHFTTIGREKLQKCPGVTYDRLETINTCQICIKISGDLLVCMQQLNLLIYIPIVM